MKTEKFDNLQVGDPYDDGEFAMAAHADLKTIRYVLDALIDKITILEAEKDGLIAQHLDERHLLKMKLEEK